jgi:hypothetical protein
MTHGRFLSSRLLYGGSCLLSVIPDFFSEVACSIHTESAVSHILALCMSTVTVIFWERVVPGGMEHWINLSSKGANPSNQQH